MILIYSKKRETQTKFGESLAKASNDCETHREGDLTTKTKVRTNQLSKLEKDVRADRSLYKQDVRDSETEYT